MSVEVFAWFGGDTYHCLRCHRVVRVTDSDDPADRAAMLEAHTAFNCTRDPYAGIVASASRAD